MLPVDYIDWKGRMKYGELEGIWKKLRYLPGMWLERTRRP
jgi:hypothetical protein